MAGYAIYLVIVCVAALTLIGIGVLQVRSKEPVGFYSGVKPPEKDQLRDVEAWNKKHGTMWILYGTSMMIAGFAGIASMTCSTIAELAVAFGGPVIMVWYHSKLEKSYLCHAPTGSK